MANILYDVMSRYRATLSDTIVRRLRHFNASHYQKMKKDLLETRVDNLVKTFLQSIKESPLVFVEYLKEIAEERYSEGVFLNEMQIVLDILEEKTWQLVVSHVPLDEQVRNLSRVTGTIGMAKDQIAQIYLNHLKKAESEIAVLRSNSDVLAGGTVSPPVGEYDLLL